MDFVTTVVPWLLVQLSGSLLMADVTLKSMNYFLMKNQIVPTSGMYAVRPVFTGSVIHCAAECDRLDSQCTSFIFKMNTSCQQETHVTVGRCQLLYFNDPDDVVLNSVTDCQRFYVANLCSRDVSNPCMNSGKCNMAWWPKICTCPIGYGGTYCEIGFDYLSALNSYYKPIFEPMSWGDATRRCKKLNPAAHLVITRSLDEYQQLISYLSTFTASQCIDSNFPSDWSGYWIAKRRQNVYAADQTTCYDSEFVWVKENTTAGQSSEQSWESSMWCSNQPDCAVNYPRSGMLETCCHFSQYYGYCLNDASCWYPHCPFCQMEAE